MSYSRVPYALAEDKLLPKIFLAKLQNTGAPWFSILVCSVAWALSLGIGFQHLVELDILIYGASLILEFIALVVLRVKEPNLDRPFKIPGGLVMTILLGVFPMLLIGLSLIEANHEQIAGMNASVFGLLLAMAGVIYYSLVVRFKQ
jgi:amino acid transporter